LCAAALVGGIAQIGIRAQSEPPESRQPQTPVRIFGNAWYVGRRGLSSIFITSAEGHVLIDVIADHIRAALDSVSKTSG
jgi:hypothetical protein